MKALLDWLDNRTGYREFVHEALYERIPGGARWRYVWGSTLVFAFATQVITGVFLWMAYSPSTETAWESVFYVQHEMQGGWLLRGIHHFMAQAMIVLLGLHLMQVVIDGAYRAPREVNFWLGLILMQIVLGLSLTGYLLPWDQKGYWATRVATNLLSVVPAVGPQMQQIVVGGSDYGHHTLTRFFALHAGILPGLLVFFLVLHISLFRRHSICAKQPYRQPDAMFFPDQVLKDGVAMLAVLIVVLIFVLHPFNLLFGDHNGPITAAHLGAELGAPADPSNQYSAARPEWYFLFLFQFLKLFEGQGERGELLGAVVIPGLVMGLLFLMPIIGKWKLGHRFNIGLLLILFAGIAMLTGAALNEDYRAKWTDPSEFAEIKPLAEQLGTDTDKIAAHFDNDPQKIARYRSQLMAYEKYRKSQDYLDAVAAAEVEAQRVIAMASSETRIPMTGAITLLRTDPLTQGPRLFATNCASCHTHEAPQAEAEPAVAAKEPSAPNLYQFASREWIAGLLDPKRVNTPEYFGGTMHKEGSMASFVTETPVCTGTFASRATFVAGKAVEKAAENARQKILEIAGKELEIDPSDLEIVDGEVIAKGAPQKKISVPDVAAAATWTYGELITGTGAQLKPYATIVEPETGKVDLPPHSAISYASCAAEVEVDDETGVVTVKRLWQCYDVGKSINPTLVEGQIEGGAVQGLGLGVLENCYPYYPSVEHRGGQFGAYLAPGMEDLPQIDTIIIENPSADGPYGAKGIGEMANNAQPPAIAAAVHDAVGVWVTELPITPERVLRALEAKAAGSGEPTRDGKTVVFDAELSVNAVGTGLTFGATQ